MGRLRLIKCWNCEVARECLRSTDYGLVFYSFYSYFYSALPGPSRLFLPSFL